MALNYFLTQAKNPTRFSFLAPGMMTDREELEALSQLRAQPPEWLLYMQLSREEFLRVFPHGSTLNWRFETLEDWFQKNYRPTDVTVQGYALWQRTSGGPPPQTPTTQGKRQPHAPIAPSS